MPNKKSRKPGNRNQGKEKGGTGVAFLRLCIVCLIVVFVVFYVLLWKEAGCFLMKQPAIFIVRVDCQNVIVVHFDSANVKGFFEY